MRDERGIDERIDVIGGFCFMKVDVFMMSMVLWSL